MATLCWVNNEKDKVFYILIFIFSKLAKIFQTAILMMIYYALFDGVFFFFFFFLRPRAIEECVRLSPPLWSSTDTVRYPSCRYGVGTRRMPRVQAGTVLGRKRGVHGADPDKVRSGRLVGVSTGLCPRGPILSAIRAVFLLCSRPCQVVLPFAGPGTTSASIWPVVKWI